MSLVFERNKLYNEDCVVGMKRLPDSSVNLTVTSPPYDTMRVYGDGEVSWDFDVFKLVAQELYRVTALGGVVIWVVADEVIEGSESGSSFRQALYFKELGFNLHDTMLYHKSNYLPLTHNRYEQVFEYMFCFSKGRPSTFDPILVTCSTAGDIGWSSKPGHGRDVRIDRVARPVKATKYHGNLFSYPVSGMGGKLASVEGVKHPAPYPEQLVADQVRTWTVEGDLVLDPFLGSGTTALVARMLRRDFVGFELVESYYRHACERVFGSVDSRSKRGLF